LASKRKVIPRLLLTGLTYIVCGGCPSVAMADKPYFITYDDQMEEPGNFEISLNPVLGLPQTGQAFLGSWTEFEYGAKGWWTSEFYLDGQSTRRDSSLFTGFRWENRFRPLAGQHWINPVLYVEYESLSGADKTLLEVVNHDSVRDLAVRNSEARAEAKHEMEGKLILSSNYRGWNISENFIAEKNLNNNPWEFGYALGVNRPLALMASSTRCRFCRENFRSGVEFYGGLGTRHAFGFSGTSQYAAPILAWQLTNGTTLRVSPTFGLNKNSARVLLRFGISYEFPRFDRHVRRWFR
jgi:hypothetical protein